MSPKLIIFLVFAILTFISCSNSNTDSMPPKTLEKITATALKDLSGSDLNPLKIIDVRSDQEFKLEHIPSSISLPYDAGHFDAIYSRLDWDKTLLIVVVDDYEHRSLDAAQKLIQSGFTNVQILESGFVEWKANGFQIEKG